jgi:hypothetical protein
MASLSTATFRFIYSSFGEEKVFVLFMGKRKCIKEKTEKKLLPNEGRHVVSEKKGKNFVSAIKA